MKVVFDVRRDRFPLDERKATVLAEELRLAAIGKRWEYGHEGARSLADKIENVLVGGPDEPVLIEGGDEEDALFHALNVGVSGSDPATEERALYLAVRPLHEARLREEDEASSS